MLYWVYWWYFLVVLNSLVEDLLEVVLNNECLIIMLIIIYINMFKWFKVWIDKYLFFILGGKFFEVIFGFMCIVYIYCLLIY